MQRSLLRDARLLALLFVCMRAALFLVGEPTLIDGSERGIGRVGDQLYYYTLAEYSERGWLPFRDWWSEFPPLWSHITVAVYQLLGAGASYSRYALMMAALMTTFDLGNLILLRALARRLYGEARAAELAWVYALLPLPLIFTYWTFEALVVFWLMLALWLYLRGQPNRAALSVVLGTLTKYTPILFALVAWRDRRPGAPPWWRLAAISVITLTLVYAALFAYGAEMTIASLKAQIGKPAYQTVWALLEGHFTTGTFGPPPARLDVSAASSSAAPLIPAWLRWGAWATLTLSLLARRQLRQERALIAACGFLLLAFYLAAQGWSPQWLLPILPLTLLVFPTRSGMLTIVALSALALADYPLLFARSGPVIDGIWRAPFIAIVLLREGLLLALCVAFYRQLR